MLLVLHLLERGHPFETLAGAARAPKLVSQSRAMTQQLQAARLCCRTTVWPVCNQPEKRSPLMRRASCMSFGMIVTLQGSTAAREVSVSYKVAAAFSHNKAQSGMPQVQMMQALLGITVPAARL
mgnify:CR=1 FL=1